MSFAEQRGLLAAQLGQLEEALRRAQSISRELGERAEAAAGDTESFADDTALAQVGALVKRSRQEIGALLRTVTATRAALGQ